MEALLAVQLGRGAKFRLVNTAFITLLPKKVDAIQVKDFCLISLIHSFAKLVAKLMANRRFEASHHGLDKSKRLCPREMHP